MASHPPETSSIIDRPAKAILVQPSSPRVISSTPTSNAQRKIGIAVDLSDESAFAVRWAVKNYIREGDAVVLIHVRPTSVLYGADWGSVNSTVNAGDVDRSEESMKKLESEFDVMTNQKANDVAKPLVEGGVPFKIHIVKDHDLKERLCLEVERLGISTLITGSRGFGATRRSSENDEGGLGSVSDYCVHHCVCPVVVVRHADERDEEFGSIGLKVVAEEEYHDAEPSGFQTDAKNAS